MNNRKTSVRGLLVVSALCAMALGYLTLHSVNMKLLAIESRLDIQNRLLGEKVDSLDVELGRLASFVRLESLWVAQGRPAYHPGESDLAGSGPGAGIALTKEGRSW